MNDLSENARRIPKIIHYCWFGGKPLPEMAQKCIASWRKYCPDYEIKEWNESNYNLNVCEYVREAYEAKKWAFVSDYARFDILYRYGGVYFDTDVELIRSIDDIIARGAFMGCERRRISAEEEKEQRKAGINRKHAAAGVTNAANPGLGLAAAPGLGLYKDILNDYNQSHFLLENGEMDQTTVVIRMMKILDQHGFELKPEIQQFGEVTIYPFDYFSPKDFYTGQVEITENTRSIHHYSASWLSESSKKFMEIKYQLFAKGWMDKWWGPGLLFLIRIKLKVESIGVKGTIRYAFERALGILKDQAKTHHLGE